MDPRVVHAAMVGWLNPRCSRCGRNQMAIQRAPFAACVTPAPALPFERPAPLPAPPASPQRRFLTKGVL